MFKILFKKLQKHGFPYYFLFKSTGKLFASTCKPHIVVDTLWTMKVSSGHFLYVDIQSLTVQAVMQHSPLSGAESLQSPPGSSRRYHTRHQTHSELLMGFPAIQHL